MDLTSSLCLVSSYCTSRTPSHAAFPDERTSCGEVRQTSERTNPYSFALGDITIIPILRGYRSRFFVPIHVWQTRLQVVLESVLIPSLPRASPSNCSQSPRGPPFFILKDTAKSQRWVQTATRTRSKRWINQLKLRNISQLQGNQVTLRKRRNPLPRIPQTLPT